MTHYDKTHYVSKTDFNPITWFWPHFEDHFDLKRSKKNDKIRNLILMSIYDKNKLEKQKLNERFFFVQKVLPEKSIVQIHGRLMLPDMKASIKSTEPRIKIFASVFTDNLTTLEKVYISYIEVFYK